MFDTFRSYVPAMDRLPKINKKKKEEQLSAAERFCNVLIELGPTAIKLGQILSARPDLMPPDYIDELVKLQDNVPSFSYKEVQKTFREEFHAEIEDLYSEFNPKPIAAASIAQGHYAKLNDGTEVFVKVRRPNIEKNMKIDLDILNYLADFLSRHNKELNFLKIKKIVHEFTTSMEEELNFEIEVSNQKQFARQFAHRKNLVIPKLWPALCGRQIITMEFIHGFKGTNIEDLKKAGIDPEKISSLGAELVLEQVFVHGFFHGDPHPGNIFYLPGNKICYVDFGQMGRISHTEQRCFAQLLVSAVNRDEKLMVKLLLKLVDYDEDPDIEELERDIAVFIDRYFYCNLNEINVTTAVQDFYDLCRRHRLSLKSHIYLLLKALGETDDMGRKLNPSFNIFKHIKPFVTKIAISHLNPKQYLQEMDNLFHEWREVIEGFPMNYHQFFQRLRAGKLQIEHRNPGLDQLPSTLHHFSKRLALSILSGFALCAGATMQNDILESHGFYSFSIHSFACFFLSGVLAILLLWDLYRK